MGSESKNELKFGALAIKAITLGYKQVFEQYIISSLASIMMILSATVASLDVLFFSPENLLGARWAASCWPSLKAVAHTNLEKVRSLLTNLRARSVNKSAVPRYTVNKILSNRQTSKYRKLSTARHRTCAQNCGRGGWTDRAVTPNGLEHERISDFFFFHKNIHSITKKIIIRHDKRAVKMKKSSTIIRIKTNKI